MFVIFTDGKVLNLNQVSLIEPMESKTEVRFHLAGGTLLTAPLDEQQMRSLVLSLQHNDPVHHVLPPKPRAQSSKIDFRDFPSVLEGENSPV